MTAPAPPATTRGRITRQDVFSVLGALGAVLSLLTAVLFYFGWRRSDEQARVMGMDVSLFGFSTQDYVLRSISALYVPVLVTLCLVLAWLWVHTQVLAWLRRALRPSRRLQSTVLWTARASAGAAAACLIFLVAAGFRAPPWPVPQVRGELQDRRWVVPLVLVLATLVAAYLQWLHRRLEPATTGEPPLWQVVLPAALASGVVLLGGVWLLEEYAAAVGRGHAQQLGSGIGRLPQTQVLSSTPLGLQAPGIEEERLDGADVEPARYRTTGLRLLARSGGKVVLLHDGWRPGAGTVIVLPDSDDYAWQFSR